MTPDTNYTLTGLTQPNGPAPNSPRRRTGLVVGLVAGGAVLLVTVAVLTTALVLRGGQPSAPVQRAAPTTTGPNNGVLGGGTKGAVIQPAIPPDTYSDADELVDWLTREGLACGEVDHVDGPTIATSMIDCGSSVVAAVYEDHAHAVRGFETLVALKKKTSDPHVYMAIGANWTVNSDDEAYARKAANRLSGEFRSS